MIERPSLQELWDIASTWLPLAVAVLALGLLALGWRR